MHPGGSGLQKEDFVGFGMPVNLDFFPYRNACSQKNQMRGPAILRINLQDESLSWIGVTGPSTPYAALAFVLLENEGRRPGYVLGLRVRGQWRGSANTHEKRTDNSEDASQAHGTVSSRWDK
jgi:hypothetical protein